MKITQVKCITL